MDEKDFDIDTHIKQDLKPNDYCVLYYKDGTMRAGRVLRHMDGKIVLENIEAGWRRNAGKYEPEITFTELYVPCLEIKEYGLAK